MKQTIVYMVAVVVDSSTKVIGYKLFNLGLNQCVIVTKEKLLDLMNRGYEISNLQLSKHGRIEVVPRSCQIKRYTWFNENGDIVEKHIPNVLITKYNGKYGREVCLLYNNMTDRTEIFEYDAKFGNNIDYVANAIDLKDSLENTIYNKLINYWTNISKNYTKIKWSLDKNLNLIDFALYTEGTFDINACLWVENMHHCICDEININGLVYGIGYHGIHNCRIENLAIDADFLESESIIDSEIKQLSIVGNTWFIGSKAIKNCKINKLILGENVELDRVILDNCKIEQLEFRGEIAGLKRECSLIENCSGLKYITISKSVSDSTFELVSKIDGGDAKIIMV